uniref:NIF system FeS cluster assembly NifU N-terminal domain-containing protein n=1 Tax=Ditylenchus dipsaci TaxID=166011 RepID=A0A915D6N0_9BILA
MKTDSKRLIDALLLGQKSGSIIPCSQHQEMVLDHYNKPKNMGSMDEEDEDVGTAIVSAPVCGDMLKLQIRVDEVGHITDTCFQTMGCCATTASGSIATEWIKGESIDFAHHIDDKKIAKALSLPTTEIHASILTQDAIESAIENYERKHT